MHHNLCEAPGVRVYIVYDASLNVCLKREADTIIHIKHLQKLMLEVFKTLNSLHPSYIRDFFSTTQVEYNLRIKYLVKLPQIKTQTFGRNSITFRSSILWNALSYNIKICKNVAALKNIIKTWKGENCSCKLCFK